MVESEAAELSARDALHDHMHNKRMVQAQVAGMVEAAAADAQAGRAGGVGAGAGSYVSSRRSGGGSQSMRSAPAASAKAPSAKAPSAKAPSAKAPSKVGVAQPALVRPMLSLKGFWFRIVKRFDRKWLQTYLLKNSD